MEKFIKQTNKYANNGFEFLHENEIVVNDEVENEIENAICEDSIDNNFITTTSDSDTNNSKTMCFDKDKYVREAPINNSYYLFLEEIKNYPLCTEDEEKWYIKKIQSGDKEAFDEFVKRNLKLVVYFAKRKSTASSLDLMDLIQEGTFGLMTAIQKFDLDKGTKFSTYAVIWIQQAMTRGIENTGNIIRLPSYLHITYLKAYSEVLQEELESGEEVSWDAIKKRLSKDVSDKDTLNYIKNFHNSRKTISFDMELPSKENGDMLVSEILPDLNPEFDPVKQIMKYDLRKSIDDILDTFSEREKEIIHLRFGMDTNIPMDCKEVSKKFGISGERVRQIEGAVIKKLRHPKYKYLKEYLK